jgi:hypothetical protein
MSEKFCGVYIIINLLTSDSYIGQSKNIYRRWKQHKTELKHKVHCNWKLQRAYNKHGESNFDFKILTTCLEAELLKAEEYWYQYYKKESYLYNVASPVESIKHSVESRLKISVSKKGNSKPNSGSFKPGHKPSPESEARRAQSVSKAKKGKKLSPEHRLKLSLAHKGKPTGRKGVRFSEEHRAKLSLAKKGKKSWNQGIKATEEHKQKLTEGHARRKEKLQKALMAEVPAAEQ